MSKAKTQTHFALAQAQATCVDGPGVDSYGDTCAEWYDYYPSSCGYYDTYSFSANDQCCACGGGDDAGTPTQSGDCADDLTVVDSWGDTCVWYDSYPSGCGYYDTSMFTASEACVSCGACNTPGETPNNGMDGECVNGSGVDSYGDGCSWYDNNSWGCGGYDTSIFSSAEQCCACGGGAGETGDPSGEAPDLGDGEC